MPATERLGAALHYELSGIIDGQVLVLVNSLGSSLKMWEKVLPSFESRYRVLRFDMRGHGKSETSPEPLTIEDLAHDVSHLLNVIETDRAHVCGLSLGGLVALWLGIHAPDRMNRLVLANTAARIGSREMWDQRIDFVRKTGMSLLAETTLERWFTPTYRAKHPEEMEQIRDMIAATDPGGYAACCAVLRDVDLQQIAELVQTPSLVITGTHDPATPAVDGYKLHKAIRNSSYLELDASHLSAWESADDFAQAVLLHLSASEELNG